MTIVGARSPEEFFIFWVYTISGPPVVGFMVPWWQSFTRSLAPVGFVFQCEWFHPKRSFLETQYEKTWKSYLQSFCTFVYSALNLYNLPNLDASIVLLSIEYNNALDKKTYDIGGLNKNHVLAPFINCFKHVRTHVLNHTHALFILLPGPFNETTQRGRVSDVGLASLASEEVQTGHGEGSHRPLSSC